MYDIIDLSSIGQYRDLLFSIKAQRDYFGAHTYERLDNPGHHVHTNWTGHGGNVSSTTYQA